MSNKTDRSLQTGYPAIKATLGIDWLSKMAGRLTDVELDRQEAHSAKLLSQRAHESECESAAMAVLNERKAVRS